MDSEHDAESVKSQDTFVLLKNSNIDEQNTEIVRDLNYYLDLVLKHANLRPPSTTNRDVWDKVEKLIVKLSLLLTQHSKYFAQVFQPLHEEDDELLKRCIRQQHPNHFTVRLFLKRTTSQGIFEVLTGEKKNVPPGQAVIRLSSELTSEDRMMVRKEWMPCLDQHNHVSLLKIHSWFDADVEKVLRKMRVENKEMKGVKVEKSPYNSLRLLLELDQDDTSRAMVGTGESTNPEPLVTVTLVPVVEGKGWPTDVPLKHPLPPSAPWSVLGSMWVSDAKAVIKDGQALWSMEEGNYAISTGSTNWPVWDLSFVQLEDIWEKRLLELDTMAHLDSALSVLNLIKVNSPLQWGLLGSDVMRHIVFNWVKNSADKNRTLADWLLVLLESIREIITPEGVCTFFCPSCSLVKKTQLPDLLELKAGVALLIADLKSDPSNIVKYIAPTNILE